MPLIGNPHTKRTESTRQLLGPAAKEGVEDSESLKAGVSHHGEASRGFSRITLLQWCQLPLNY